MRFFLGKSARYDSLDADPPGPLTLDRTDLESLFFALFVSSVMRVEQCTQ
jgi:hypothetical protein